MDEHELGTINSDDRERQLAATVPFLSDTDSGVKKPFSEPSGDIVLTLEERGELSTAENQGTPPQEGEREEVDSQLQRFHTEELVESSPPPSANVDAQQSNESTMENNGCLYCVLIIVGIGALLTVILVPLGFSDLDYYEMGFVKSKTTGKVDVSKVYLGGRHFVGVDKTFKPFKSDAHIEAFDRMIIFNKEKLQVTMTCALEYFLYPQELAMLHNAYDVRYRPILKKTLLAAIKVEAAKYTVNQYRLERQRVAKALTEAAKTALGGTCCRDDCNTTTTCKKADRGLFAEVRYFQMELVDITKEQEDRFLRQVIETEKQDTADFYQKELLTRKETERMKRIIENAASEIAQNATAASNLIKARADAEAKAITEDARNSGLQVIYELLNITKPEHKKSFDYLRTLLNSESANMYVGFSTMVAKPET